MLITSLQESPHQGWILSKFFVDKAFSEDAKTFGDNIVSGIKEQFIKKLNMAEWMSQDVRKLGIKKGNLRVFEVSLICWLMSWCLVHNIVQKIGYPTKSPDLHNSSALQEYYAGVNISSTGYFQNAISVVQFDVHREWSALGKPTDRDEWDMTAPTVNVSR